jgi:hypothetical protein
MTTTTGQVLELQLASRPRPNPALRLEPTAGGGLVLVLPVERPAWTRRLAWLIRLPPERRLELDDLGAALFGQCDGQRTVEQLVDALAARWQLSFFEARGLVLHLLKRLVQRQYLLLVVPEPAPSADGTGGRL